MALVVTTLILPEAANAQLRVVSNLPTADSSEIVVQDGSVSSFGDFAPAPGVVGFTFDGPSGLRSSGTGVRLPTGVALTAPPFATPPPPPFSLLPGPPIAATDMYIVPNNPAGGSGFVRVEDTRTFPLGSVVIGIAAGAVWFPGLEGIAEMTISGGIIGDAPAGGVFFQASLTPPPTVAGAILPFGVPPFVLATVTSPNPVTIFAHLQTIQRGAGLFLPASVEVVAVRDSSGASLENGALKHGRATTIDRQRTQVIQPFLLNGTLIDEVGSATARAFTLTGGEVVSSDGGILVQSTVNGGPMVTKPEAVASATSQGDGEFAKADAAIKVGIDNAGNLSQSVEASALAFVIPTGDKFRLAEAEATATKRLTFTQFFIGGLFEFTVDSLSISLALDPIDSFSRFSLTQSTDIAGLEHLWVLQLTTGLDDAGQDELIADFQSNPLLGLDDETIEDSLAASFVLDPLAKAFVFQPGGFAIHTSFIVLVNTWTLTTEASAFAHAEYKPVPESSTVLFGIGMLILGACHVRRRILD